MKNKILEKPNYELSNIWSKGNTLKAFNLIPKIDTSGDIDIYLKFINLWNESTKFSGFFDRERFDISSIKNICYIHYNGSKDKITAFYNDIPIEFSSVLKLWEYFDEKKHSIIFYCKNFNSFSPKIKSFLNDALFTNSNRKYIGSNQWKSIKYKDEINSFWLSRSKLEFGNEYRWEMYFLPFEDERIQESKKILNRSIKNKDLYEISLNILMKFIIAIYSQNNENIKIFLDELNKKIGHIENNKLQYEIDKKINMLFNNRSENKCLKAIIWLGLLVQNNSKKLMEIWAKKNNIKINNKTILKWVEFVNKEEWIEIIEVLRDAKNEVINFLKITKTPPKKIKLSHSFISDFINVSIQEKSFAVLGDTLFHVYFDDAWKFKEDYLKKILGIYAIDKLRDDRDLSSLGIHKAIIFNPLYMEYIQVNIDDLNNFYKDNFDVDLSDFKQEFRKALKRE